MTALALLVRYWRPLVVLLLTLAVIGFFYAKGHKAGLAKGRAELAAFQLEVGGRILEANAQADRAAQDFEAWKRSHRPKVITIIKEVDRAIETAPEWSRAALPDGVRDALNRAAAAAADDPGEPARAVPPVSGLDAADERGPCAGLPRRLGVGCGVPGETAVAE